MTSMTPTPLATLDELDEQLGASWPSSLADYADGVRAIAAALRSTDPGVRRAAWQPLHDLLEREFRGFLCCRDEAERQARRDAFNEVVSDVPALAAALEKAAARLRAERAPNFCSFFVAKLIWRANEILESEVLRHARRLRPVADPHSLCPAGAVTIAGARAAERRVLANQLLAFAVSRGQQTADAFALLMGDVSVAEAARRTGLSRQQIYRLLAEARRWADTQGAAA